MPQIIDEEFTIKQHLANAKMAPNDNDKLISIVTGGFNSLITLIQKRFSDKLIRVIPSKATLYKNSEDINQTDLQNLRSLMEDVLSIKDFTPEEFAKIKYSLDNFFFSITTQGRLEYMYDKNYLISPSQLADELNFTRQTISKYVKEGLEHLGNNHKKHPRHNKCLIENYKLFGRIQLLNKQYKEREKTVETKLKENMDKIKVFEKNYGGSFEEVYANVLKDDLHWDETENFSDYLIWESLIDEQKKLKQNSSDNNE